VAQPCSPQVAAWWEYVVLFFLLWHALGRGCLGQAAGQLRLMAKSMGMVCLKVAFGRFFESVCRLSLRLYESRSFGGVAQMKPKTGLLWNIKANCPSMNAID
jgi:hypothetical protein